MERALDLHGQAMQEFDRRVTAVDPAQWHAATPCREWDVTDLVDHLVDEQRWVPHLLRGLTMAQAGEAVSAAAPAGDPARQWSETSRAARDAWLADGVLERTVHLSYGDASADHYLWEMTADLTIHAWDLARAIGADERLDPALVSAMLDWIRPLSGELVGSGLFDPPVAVPDDADDQTRLLALSGRRTEGARPR